jgi:hypothetical protein
MAGEQDVYPLAVDFADHMPEWIAKIINPFTARNRMV